MSKITNNYCYLFQCVIGNKVAMKKKETSYLAGLFFTV